MTRILLSIIALAVVSVLAGCSRPSDPEPEVIVLHSGRMRGNVYPATLQNISPLQHYQYLAGYIRAVRAEAEKSGARVFVVDLGDSLGGSFASHVTASMNMVTFFNEAGYDAVMLSNLDANVPAASIAQIRARVLNPFTGPDGKPPVPGTSAGARFDLGGVPVDLLANFYGDTDPVANPGRFPASFADEPKVSPVRDYTAVLAALGERTAGTLTLLAWMKFEPSGTPPAEFLAQLRANRIDAILAHRIYGGDQREAWQASGFVDWNPPVSLNILRNNGGFALARMDLARDGDGWRVLSHQLIPMTANTATADQQIVEAIEGFAEPIVSADTPLLQLEAPVDRARILAIYMNALAGISGTEAVVYSPDSIRSDWSAGELRASGVFQTLPWTDRLVQLVIDSARVRQLPDLAGLHVLVRSGLPDGPVVVTTSRFFATVISSKLGLPATAIADLPGTSEFDFFVEYLRQDPGAVAAGVPDGWEPLAP